MIEGSGVGVVIDGSSVPASVVLPVDSVVSGVVSAVRIVQDVKCIYSIKSTIAKYNCKFNQNTRRSLIDIAYTKKATISYVLSSSSSKRKYQ